MCFFCYLSIKILFQFFNAAFLFFFHFRFFYYWPPYLLGLIEPHFCLRPSNIKTDTQEPRGKPQIIRKGRLYKKTFWHQLEHKHILRTAFACCIPSQNFPRIHHQRNQLRCWKSHNILKLYKWGIFFGIFFLQFNECELSEIQRHLYCFYL